MLQELKAADATTKSDIAAPTPEADQNAVGLIQMITDKGSAAYPEPLSGADNDDLLSEIQSGKPINYDYQDDEVSCGQGCMGRGCGYVNWLRGVWSEGG